MDFFQIMLNLMLGIIGGIFSSIIVSRVFLIITDYSEQISRIQTRVEVTYGIHGVLEMAYWVWKDDGEVGEKFKQKLKEIVDSESKYYAQMIFDDLEDELHILAIEFNDFIDNLNVNKLNIEIIGEKIKVLDELTCKFTVYKNSRKKKLMRLFLKDTALRSLFVIFSIIVFLTILA